jgi:hypothetical protein
MPIALQLLPPELRDRLMVVQQCREEDIDRVFDAYEVAGVAAELATFFDDLPYRMGGAHLVVCRSGATSCAELLDRCASHLVSAPRRWYSARAGALGASGFRSWDSLAGARRRYQRGGFACRPTFHRSRFLSQEVAIDTAPQRITSSWSGPSYRVAGAQQARHFIMRLLRAGQRSAPPLNCGVSSHELSTLNSIANFEVNRHGASNRRD